MRMKLKYTILYVDDVIATLKFYEAAFGIATRKLHGEADYGELETGDMSLSFCARKLMQAIGKPTGLPQREAPVFEIAFETDDVAKAYQHALAHGALPVSAPEAMPWGQTVSYVTDLNGYMVEICSPVVPPT